MSDHRFDLLTPPMIERGFVREGKKRKGDALWTHMQAGVIQYEVCLQDSDWNPGHFGCSIRVRYSPSPRRSWSDAKDLFFYDVVDKDFLPRGFDLAGTSGAACWPYTNVPAFFIAFDRDVVDLFRRFTDLRELATESRQLSKENPRNYSLIAVCAFAHYELGEWDESRKLFDEFMTKFPSTNSWFKPFVEELFKSPPTQTSSPS